MDFFNSPQFQERVEALMREHHVPGLSIAIVQDDAVASAGYGKASVGNDKPCTPDTLFDIASSSKSLTAASVALLVEDDSHPEVKYEALMTELLPGDFEMSGADHTKSVTLDDLLGHRTGLPR
jgi:CubicO group peptidase (beta-lactamase class C family)